MSSDLLKLLQDVADCKVEPEEALELLQSAQQPTPEAPATTLPSVFITLDANTIKVQLQNWHGVNAVMMERMYYALIKENQQFRATNLQRMRQMDAQKALEEKTRDPLTET